MSNKLISKLLATMLVITLTLANVFLLGTNAQIAFAAGDLESQGTQTNNANVKFDAYFTNEQGEKTHDITTDIASENTKIKFHIQVKEGYLKNSTIRLSRNSGGKQANFNLISQEEMPETIKNIDNESGQIYLNQINKDSEVILEIPITSLYGAQFDLSDLSSINDIKITGTYVTNEAKEVQIYKSLQTKVTWTATPQAYLEQQVEKYVPFVTETKQGVVVQTKVLTGLQDNALPIQKTQLQVAVPNINGIKPEQVKVYATTTATNSSFKFSQDNYAYDAQTGIITIVVENEAQDNIVSWEKDGKDEFVITYVFGQEAKEALENAELVAQQEATVSIKAYDNTQEVVTANTIANIKLDTPLNNIVTYQIKNTPVLYKGYLYNQTKETIYQVEWNTNIGYSELIDKIELTQTPDVFLTTGNKQYSTTVAGNNYAEYKSTKISKANFLEILGEDGFIRIYNENGQQISEINTKMEADVEQNYVFTYDSNINNISIQTSKPITEGELKIQHTKAIKSATDYSRTQLENFNKLQVNMTGKAYNETTEMINQQVQSTISLEEQTTKFDANINTKELSTVIKNEDVQIQVILNTNNEANELYKNPTVYVELPSYVKQVELKQVELLYDTELNITNKEMYYNEAGNIVIKVTLNGTQTQYNTNTVTNGAAILMHADMILDQLAPTKTEIVKVFVKNENATRYENTVNEMGHTETEINLVAPVGIVAINSIKNYNTNQEKVTSLNGNISTGKLQVEQQEQIATIEQTVINNYVQCNNVQILGRTPFEGNKNINNTEDLNSTFTTNMVSEITAQGVPQENVEIYYSENENATKELLDEQNGWTKTPANLEQVKSYLIVLQNYIVEKGTVLTFSYNVRIPAGLQHNEQVYSNYEVYYQNAMLRTINEEKEVAAVVGLTTGEGPVLETNISASIENEVQERSILTYTIAVKNNGTKAVQNVKVKSNIPDNTVYVKQVPQQGEGVDGTRYEEDYTIKTFETIIDNIEPGETKTVQYEVKTNMYYKINTDGIDREDYPTEEAYQQALQEVIKEQQKLNIVTAKATISVDGYETIFNTNEITQNIIKGLYELTIQQNMMEIGDLYLGKEFEVVFKIRNINSEIKENMIIKTQLPKELVAINIPETVQYDSSTNTIIWNIQKLNSYESDEIVVKLRVNSVEEIEKILELKLQGSCDGTQQVVNSNSFKLNLVKPILTVTQTSDIPEGQLQEGDIIKYHIQVQNIGAGTAGINVVNTLSQGLEITQMEYGFETQSAPIKTIGQTATVRINIPAQKILHITVTAKVEKVGEEIRKDLTSNVIVTSQMAETVEANVLNHYVIGTKQEEDQEPTNPNDPQNPSEQQTYRIAGTAWLDANKNGIMEIEETKLGNIPVMLVNADTGVIVQDGVNTDEKGNYTFTKVQKGKYIVVFLYDSSKYGVTEYKKTGIEDSINSDALEMQINVNGTNQLGGATNTIDISTQNAYGVNLGLVENPKFDLKLEKTVNKITVQNASGTKTYEYGDSKLAKVEINSKYVNSTNLIIEYKIKVTNEGAVAGYAKKIVDYLPAELKFSSELNSNWYAAENNYIYNAELANTLIQPGESKEITLIVTKKMSEDILGIINNTAEIQESYNDQGLEDLDSTPANKAEGEDDISSADVLLSLNTGTAVTYTILVITLITILGIGIYIINKRFLRKI